MSGGTPRSTFVRQRHSWGYASSSDDLEDDACSRLTLSSPSISRAKSWVEVLENVVWIASALFIIYFGDWHYNFIHLVLHDERIRRVEHGERAGRDKQELLMDINLLVFFIIRKDKRTPLYLGLFGVLLNVAYFFYASLSNWGLKKYNEKWEVIGDYALQFVTLGFMTFCLLTFALWPIWKFLTLPLVFTLFMACMVLSPYLINGSFKSQSEVLRDD